MKKLIYAILICFVSLTTFQKAKAQVCWAKAIPYATFWDSCSNNKASLNAYIYFKVSTSCFKYEWTVNGNVVDSNYLLHYNITQNGSYNVCIKIKDTCNNCDTTICSKRTITCFNSTCNWAARYPNTYFKDTCYSDTGRLTGYVSFNSNLSKCFKYAWTLNGNSIGTNSLYILYNVTQNGTYNLCCKVTDTCNNCDTTFCSSRVISCISNKTCNWATRNPYATFWDSCTSGAQSLNAYIVFKNYSTSCFKYKWSVNGTLVDSNKYIFNYQITQNGTYELCVKIIDTCNNCDTTICSKRTITCFGNNSTCNWASRYPYLNHFDTCTSTVQSLNAYVAFKYSTSCFKYQWTVNGNSAGTNSNYINYSIKQNGTYEVCIKITDTCNKCDTTICSKRTFSCFGNNSNCNWASKYTYTYFWDTCNNTTQSLNGYVSFQSSSSSCFKYLWTVNGNKVGTGYKFNYPISQNGYYNVCIKVMDTCNNCDTTICSKRNITCIGSSSKCDWASQKVYTYFWDTCNNTTQSLNGYVSFQNSGSSCFKYLWTVNGNVVGKGLKFNYPISQNGYYNVCLKITDTCNNCDTTICSKRSITCFGSSSTCNWASKYPYVYIWDSCNSKSNTINAYVSFKAKGCFKYQWKVAGNSAGNDYLMQYAITKNGTYIVCVKVTDTCNNCDTVICVSHVVTCFTNNTTCNWASRYPYTYFKDTCKNGSASLIGNISFNSNLAKCFKYQWSVNGYDKGTNIAYFNYSVTQNGTYNICVKVTDTCNNCDTTFCSSLVVTCLGNSNKCNWASKTPHVYVWDSCKSSISSVNAYVSFKVNGCYKYQWTVNGNSAGNGYILKYAIFNNGTYKICVKVTDTCNNCDTTICTSRTINCFNGLNYIDQTEGIKIYPNPTQGIVKLEWNKGNSSYVIYNVAGQSLSTGNLTNGAQTLDLSAYPTGLYILQVKTADANISKKIFLQKD
ncbi:MAG: T9SS type A sorting domain-containing protein [Bacteroidota bacterium]|nr:T9SS type A sorting domain-containing protein [Bacteroidota bacterium]